VVKYLLSGKKKTVSYKHKSSSQHCVIIDLDTKTVFTVEFLGVITVHHRRIALT